MNIYKELHKKDIENVINKIVKSPSYLKDIFQGVSSSKANIKFGCIKVLRIISEKEPRLLYPYWSFFVELLDCDNNILRWNAIYIIGQLTKVDSKNKFSKIFKRFFNLINQKKMITAANVVSISPVIIDSKPTFMKRITRILLSTEKGQWETDECKNILLGKVILAFNEYFNKIDNNNDKKEIIGFVKKRLKNKRNATKVKAEKFLRKYSIN